MKEEYLELKECINMENLDKNTVINMEIIKLKTKLKETDYQAIKFAEGIITAEEYEPTKQQRQEWRDEINRLEEEMKK